MKDRYGFDFYDDLINHDYDSEKSIGSRITMLIDEVTRLKNNKFISFKIILKLLWKLGIFSFR